MVTLLKELVAAWRKGWRARKVKALREKLVRLEARKTALMEAGRAEWNPFHTTRLIDTKEEIMVTRWRIRQLGIEGVEL